MQIIPLIRRGEPGKKDATAALLLAPLLLPAAARAEPLAIKVGVLRQAHSRETLSIQDIPAEDDALAGALMGAADNNTTANSPARPLRLST